ncbi:hypothetical protein A1O3_09852 [Capronia epimyces CBS 606.96]|uniref:AAA+ ATPase domain-containing protein n=1 Tax=Capronia epimyces CBS 606.96 TaxID=1182542 RepID=W9Y589_9EURO|nr:uncharacterized protein A1O3_09852 [Capronia epimyces CBS 606.96]EXJ77624.1 hypothetical protein A1O3_09852 [Capronia epimyces CBS 606.96]
MPPPPPAQNLSLSITNPLVLYRTLVATKKIRPDPAQHRLALQLQKLYFRLKDYAPEVEYRYRLERIGRRVNSNRHPKEDGTKQRPEARRQTASQSTQADRPSTSRGMLTSLLSSTGRLSAASASALALVTTTPLHHSAVQIDSPQGMLLYGEVGRGKSMLLDLLYTSLPSRKKRRWHFNTFMLDIFRRIEAARLERLEDSQRPRPSLFGPRPGVGLSDHEHVVLALAKDTISESPILFLDEFQMPDRTASKLINSFFTAFFHLGGVLVASSNRMPEELSKAAGVEFGGYGYGHGHGHGPGRRHGMGGFFGLGWGLRRASEGERAAKTDFGLFLDILRARCEVWEMEGNRDWRREDYAAELVGDDDASDSENENENQNESDPTVTDTEKKPISTATAVAADARLSSDSPPHHHIKLPSLDEPKPVCSSSALDSDVRLLNPSATWTPTTLTVYARPLRLETTHDGILKSSFDALCASYLGPADYVSLCSTFHTLILTDVPVLTLALKNEARRFITLLDALYEARCRLVIEAAAPPDKLFFPEAPRSVRTRSPGATGVLGSGATRITGTRSGGGGGGGGGDGDYGGHDGGDVSHQDETETETLFDADHFDSDSITSESFSEMYQDSTAPFRPNVSSYSGSDSTTPPSLAFTASLSTPSLRSVLADEDADFGPTYGNGRGHGVSNSSTAFAEARFRFGGEMYPAPDFTSTAALTGEDERFAYKRARSRLWEMCGRRWWDERLPRRAGTGAGAGTGTGTRTSYDGVEGSDDALQQGFHNAMGTGNADIDIDANPTTTTTTAGHGSEDRDGVRAWWRPVTRDGRFWEQVVDEAEAEAENEVAKKSNCSGG